MTTKRTVLWESCGVRPLTGCCVVARVDLGPCVRVRVENPCGLSRAVSYVVTLLVLEVYELRPRKGPVSHTPGEV